MTPLSPGPLATGTTAFIALLGPLLGLVNPLAGAVVFGALTADLARAERQRVGLRVAAACFAGLLLALYAGRAMIALLGLDLDALRVAGGLVLAANACQILRGLGRPPTTRAHGIFPLAVPITVGPGTIALVISSAPASGADNWPVVIGQSGAVSVACLAVAVTYLRIDWLLLRLGRRSLSVAQMLGGILLLVMAVQTGLAGAAALLSV